MTDIVVLDGIFDTFLFLFDNFLSKARPLKFPENHEILIKFKSLNFPNWLENYELGDIEFLERFFSTFTSILGINAIDENMPPEKILEMLSKLKSASDDNFKIIEEKIGDKIEPEIIPIIIAIHCNRVRVTCLLKFREPISDIIDLAKNGDPNALIKLVRLDPMFLSQEYSRKILAEMQFTKNIKFWNNLSKSLSPDPII